MVDLDKDEILSWVKAVKQLGKARTKANMTRLIDLNPVELFEIRFLKKEAINYEELQDGFVELYEKFCERVIAGSDYEAGSGRLVDSISSFAKLIYLMDLGYGIYVSILFSRADLIEPHYQASKKIKQAFEILLKKRWYLHEYLDPFSSHKIKLDREKSLIEAGVDFLVRSGYSTDAMLKEYSQLTWDLMQAKNLNNSSVRDLVIDLLNKENKALRIDETDPKINRESFFHEINRIIPDFKFSDFKMEFDREKSQLILSGNVFGKPMTCVVNYGDGLDKIADLLNPLIEKNTGLSLLCVDKLSGFKFVLVTKERKEGLRKNILVYS